MADRLARSKLARAAARLNRSLGRPLPALVFLTDEDRVARPREAVDALPRGSLVILRARRASRRLALAETIAPIANAHGLVWLVADDPELAAQAGADGVHFPEARIAEAHHWRAVRDRWLITCAAHSLGACARIARAGADAALLAPVFPTASHAGGTALGPLRLRVIANQSPLPIYALGGVDAATALRLRGAKLAGLAAIGALAV